MNAVWIGLAGGALAFVHCLGMCGGFALHLAGAGRPMEVLRRQLLWHAGKAVTYVFLGALAGFGGGLIHSLGGGLAWGQKALTYACGGVMIVMGLILLGLLPAVARKNTLQQEGGLGAALFRNFFQQPTAGGALALGLATGFLPCPIVLAFLAYSAQSGSVAVGMITMAAMAAGTLWSLLLAGMTGHLIHAGLRRRSAVMGGVVLVLLGAATALRGTDTLHRVLGCPHSSSGASCCEGKMPEAPRGH